MKLSKWQRPGTNEVRVYFNGITTDSKVFAVDNDGNYEIRFSPRLYNSEQDRIMDMIDVELREANGGEPVVKFDDLLSLCK